MLAFLSFFEELEVDEQPTEEAQPRRRPRMPRRPGSGGGGGRSGGGRTPGLQRLLILAGVVLLVGVIAIWQIRSCQRDQEVKSYKDFVSDSNTIAKTSTDIGKEFSGAIIKQGQTPDALLSTIEQEISKQQGVVRNAAALDGPGAMGGLQPYFLNSMQYRQSGLQGVHDALEQAFSNQNRQDKSVTQDEAAQVSATLNRLIASDVVYEDSYRQPAVAVLKDKNIEGVAVDPSVFVDERVMELASPKQMQVILESILGGTPAADANADGGTDTSGTDTQTDANGRHGLSLDADCCSYLADPNATAKQLSPTELNEADANSDGPMTLRVQVKNSGDFPESDLTVTVQIDDKEFTQKITALDKGQEETVDIDFTIDDIDVSLETSITVTAEPVENEFNKQNNQQKFRVQFQLA